VLEDKLIRPLGGGAPEKVDVRLVAATNVILEQSDFRRDLLARLGDWTIQIPALADRRADVLVLWRHFVEADAPNTTPAELLPELAEALLIHAWPMNIRELRKLAGRLTTLSSPDLPLEVTQLPEAMRQFLIDRDASWNQPTPDLLSEGDPAEVSSGPDRSVLEASLRSNKGNVRRVAAELGCHRTQLYRWLRRWNLNPDAYR
jgi:transcriptional regulator with PAS, ATPase and Fis domain